MYAQQQMCNKNNVELVSSSDTTWNNEMWKKSDFTFVVVLDPVPDEARLAG